MGGFVVINIWSKKWHLFRTILFILAILLGGSLLSLSTVYALESEITCAVTFISNGGTDVPSQNVQLGGLVIKPADPTRPNEVFEGWYRDTSLLDQWDFESHTVTADTILYAKWTPTDEKKNASAFVARMYQWCLSREPDQAGLDYWVGGLLDGSLDGSEIARSFLFSTEFINRNVDNETYLEILYKSIFDRSPDEQGFLYWRTILEEGMTRYYVLVGFTRSGEFINLANSFGVSVKGLPLTDPADLYPDITRFVYRLYVNLLGRAPDGNGLNFWVGSIQSRVRSGAEVAYGFVFSPEFTGRSVSNDTYVRTLYKTLFDREPDAGGYDNWLTFLNTGGSRYNVLANFTNSEEFGNLSKSYGIARGTLNPWQNFTAIFYILSGRTATGTTTTAGRTIAVDPKVIPFGTEVYIEGWGYRIAEDSGGFTGNIVDIYVNSLADIPRAGRISVQLRIVG